MKVYPVKPVSKLDLEKRAEAILSQFAPECLRTPSALDVRKFLDVYLDQEFGWSIDVRDALPADTLGYCNPTTRTINISEETYDAIGADDGRARFTGCHEGSHVILHGDQMRDRMVSFAASEEYLYRQNRVELKAFENPEWQADFLAGALLMPARMIRVLKRGTASEEELIQKMCDTFKVSRQAADVRLKKMVKEKW